jgi:Leucine-rich repeat (LRR) protein
MIYAALEPLFTCTCYFFAALSHRFTFSLPCSTNLSTIFTPTTTTTTTTTTIKKRLHSNRFTGLIPAELADLRALRTLSLSENQFIGSIPAELGTLIYLKKLLLAKNKLNGRIPHELGSLQNLEYLLLTGNKFTDAANAAGRLQRHLPNCRIDLEV